MERLSTRSQRTAHLPSPASPLRRTSRMWVILLGLVLASITGCEDAADPAGPVDPTPPAVGEVRVTPAQHELDPGQTVQAQVQVLSATGGPLTGRTITWTTSAAAVATVDANGLVRAVATGTATVRATAGGRHGTLLLTVRDTTTTEPPQTPSAPAITTLTPARIAAGAPDTEIVARGRGFDGHTVAYWNGSSRYAVVESDSVLRVTLRAEDLRLSGQGRLWLVRHEATGAHESNRVPFEIDRALSTIEVVAVHRLLFVGETFTYQAVAKDDRGERMEEVDVTWSSNDPSTVEVDAEGRVVARRVGTTLLRASADGRSGTVQVRVAQPPVADLMVTTWSPFGPERSATTIDLEDGGSWSVRPVPDGARQAEASPDGQRIVFVLDAPGGGADLWLVEGDGRNLRRLTTNPELDDQPSWSPDGRTIAFRSARGGLIDVWTIGVDGTGLRQVTDFGPFRLGDIGAERPTWSPDGQWIAFAWGSMGMTPTRKAISVVRPDGTDLRRVTQPGATEDTEPSFSPDGTQIAFRRTAGGQHRIVITDLTGQEFLFLTDLGFGRTPRWSPDGRWLAYIGHPASDLSHGMAMLKEIGTEGQRTIGSAFDVTWIRR